ncbi:hypothetical protein [Winogradskyella helgolandensis]|uniref:hypothetical protein n=1 Tax=Winogradskyella helgolandensis TaxID=2697010 RepID=UPI0015BE5C62|nr:hypothetical protein [Winogradskyella helgolandensis]
MAILILFVSLFVGGITFILVRLSISCIFWASKYRHDKMRVFKLYFPYYIISLFTLSVAEIIGLDKHIAAIYYFSFVFIVSLLIWKYELIQSRKTQHQNNNYVKSNHPELP